MWLKKKGGGWGETGEQGKDTEVYNTVSQNFMKFELFKYLHLKTKNASVGAALK